MESTGPNIRTLLMELSRIEGRVWARNPEEARAGEGRAGMLFYLMTEHERRKWRAVDAIIGEMRKLI